MTNKNQYMPSMLTRLKQTLLTLKKMNENDEHVHFEYLRINMIIFKIIRPK